jgi:hypothetical protein
LAIETRGQIKTNWLGGRSGILESNKSKVDAYLRELEKARVSTVELQFANLDEGEIAEQLTRIRNNLPLKNFEVEVIESEGVAGVAIATALANS